MEADVRELFDRSIRGATEKHSGHALDRALSDLGWRDALVHDARDAVSILFERQGEVNATSSAIASVALDALGTPAEGIVLPALGQWRPPATRSDDRFVVDGLALGGSGRWLVVADVESKELAAFATALEVTDASGIDPLLGLQRVRGSIDLSGAQPVAWSVAVAATQRALAHELIGASRTMLELARLHALERVQFGRPIAMFQAVRHRLAEALLAIETAAAALDAAWIEESPISAAMAKALAGRGAQTAARHCQQVLAGIGFTTEHSLHHYIRRVLVLDQLFGSSTLLTRELGAGLLATRCLPRALPL